eukprot:TRINITY_DN30603_c0_g1_i1.p1 TRINITY_DN30603_c0_g1~~TRINITY_DN30603_c0_g1_i1.p1  ORF type:complete len:297 (+),score=142.24 TRINITY_DN30603_c0_g1_i1:66-893(+)
MAGKPADAASVDSSVVSSIYARSNATPSRSLNARRLRMAAENDVQFLANRLAKLKQEEMKAKREIDRTRRKTHEVLSNRRRFEDTTTEKKEMRDQVDYAKKKEAALVALNREKQAKAIWMSKQRLLLDKKESVTTLRKQKEVNECRVHIFREEERDRNMKQREAIRNMRSLSRLRREREMEEKAERIRCDYEARISREEAERERKERLATQLVTQEAQLIYRLKRMHQEKQAAIRELANAVDITPHNTSGSTLSVPKESRIASDPDAGTSNISAA